MSSQMSPRSVVDWGSQLLAYTFAMHFLFGTVAVLNTSGLSFFFYYPRKIDIVFVDPNVDVLVWAGFGSLPVGSSHLVLEWTVEGC